MPLSKRTTAEEAAKREQDKANNQARVHQIGLIFVLFLLGVAGGFALAESLDGKSLDRGFWGQLLTITGLSALPLVGLAARAPAYTGEKLWSACLAVAAF